MEVEDLTEQVTCLKSIQKQVEVPLYHTDTNISITDHIAQIDFTQYYMNKSNEEIEMEFSQPVHAKVVFANFEIKVGDKTLLSQVRTTKEAQIIYSDNVAAKKSAGIGRYVKNT